MCTSVRAGKQKKCIIKSVHNLTHCYDVIFPETQFIVIVSLEIKQSLCTSPPVARYNKEVLVILLVTLHGIVRSQVLKKNKTKQNMEVHGIKVQIKSQSNGMNDTI